MNRFITKTKIDPNRPVRNRTAYNLFYKYQRKVLLNSIYSKDTVDEDEGDDKEKVLDEKNETAEKLATEKNLSITKKKTVQEVHAELRMHFDELFGENRPVRQKRLHRKTSGTIRLHELTKIMALKWANANEDVRSFFRKEAEKDLRRYESEMREYSTKRTKAKLEILCKNSQNLQLNAPTASLISCPASSYYDPRSNRSPQHPALVEKPKQPRTVSFHSNKLPGSYSQNKISESSI